jgi:hypothetical protein
VLKQPQPPIPYDQVDTPGGIYVLAFPTAAQVTPYVADRPAVHQALQMLGMAPPCRGYHTGLEGHDAWVRALEDGTAIPRGNSCNAHCWAEAKHFAREFLTRLAKRNDAVSGPLTQAAQAYAETADAMGHVAKLFPFPGKEEKAKDPAVCAQAIEHLRAAKAAETRGVEALERAVCHRLAFRVNDRAVPREITGVSAVKLFFPQEVMSIVELQGHCDVVGFLERDSTRPITDAKGDNTVLLRKK